MLKIKNAMLQEAELKELLAARAAQQPVRFLLAGLYEVMTAMLLVVMSATACPLAHDVEPLSRRWMHWKPDIRSCMLRTASLAKGSRQQWRRYGLVRAWRLMLLAAGWTASCRMPDCRVNVAVLREGRNG